MRIVLRCIQKIDNAVVKKQQEEAPPYSPSFCLVTNNLLGLERKCDIKSYLTASALLHRNHSCDRLAQGHQNKNDPFSVKHVQCEDSEKYSAPSFFLGVPAA